MNFGSLAGGLAEGLGSGYRTGMLADNLRNQREMEGRRMGIMEDDARQRRALTDQTMQRNQRDLDREAREEAAWKESLAVLAPDPSTWDPNLPASEQVGRVLMAAKPNAETWTKVAAPLLRSGNTKGLEFLNFAWKAREEGAADALRALTSGDMEGAKTAFNGAGQHRVKSIEPTGEGPDGTQSGVFKFTYEDGTTETHNAREAFTTLSSPSAYANYMASLRKQQEESEKNRAEIELKQADAANKRGDNPTKIKVAEINANRSNKGRGRGAGGGAGGGDDGGPDMLDATRRVQIQKDVDEFVRSNFGTPDPVTGDPAKARHNDNSRRLSTIAAQLMMAAENGGKPMTIQDAGRLATEGRAVYGGAQVDPKGRLVAQQSWEVNGQVYPMGAATRALGKEEVLEYLDTTRSRAIESGKTITPDMLKDVPIDKWAKQAGMKPQELVDRLVNGPKTVTESPPGRVPNQGGSGGGIISGAEAGEPGGAGAAASGRGIASESADVSKAKDLDRRIQALEARGDLLPESAKKQLADLKAQRKGTGISSAQIQAADLQGEIRNLEEAIVRLKKTDTGFDKRRAEQIKRLEAQRDQMRARLGGAATSGISREQMR